ncbi:NUDIX domain-containing protein [Kineosporia sp. A_224]|uniref:NUDIX hydrolase n=1 Tax=Kineosporia sp. A_224 TaxID=1962180 RepID=UPI000B4AB8D3|nr:NUDIX domain-containing protein [Kineosporia sp. A_224]
MPTPEFVLRLREKIGHDLLFMPAVCGVVVDADGRVLLGRRSDTGGWTLVGGIMEPGEDVADAVVREVREETGIVVRPDRIVSVFTIPPMLYPNGDEVSYVITTFRCTPLSGEAHVADDESLEVGWFGPDELPPLPDRDLTLLVDALRDDGVVSFPSSR